MCCGHDPDIYPVGPAAAQALELLLLQYTQKLWLQRSRNIPYLIQKKRALVRHLETPEPLCNGPSECTFFMTE